MLNLSCIVPENVDRVEEVPVHPGGDEETVLARKGRRADPSGKGELGLEERRVEVLPRYPFVTQDEIARFQTEGVAVADLVHQQGTVRQRRQAGSEMGVVWP